MYVNFFPTPFIFSSNSCTIVDAGIAHETQAELARLADALERSEVEVQQLIKTNEDLVKLRQDDEYQIKV